MRGGFARDGLAESIFNIRWHIERMVGVPDALLVGEAPGGRDLVPLTGSVALIILLSRLDNTPKLNNIFEALCRQLAERLPPGWRILPGKRAHSRVKGYDAILRIREPGGKTGAILVEAKARLEPKDVAFLPAKMPSTDRKPVLIVSAYLSPRTQERLVANGMGYADLTGNIRLVLPQPGLFVQATGATENPFSTRRDRKSLRGAKAGRLVRALCDFRPPMGLRSLAKRAGIDAGYASRLVDFLDREALITRDPRGAIAASRWQDLIRRWAQAYSPLERERVIWYLAPRGLPAILNRLKNLSARYAISGSWAASQLAPVAATRLILCYSDDREGLARMLDLRLTDTGANVALATPFDPVVYDRTLSRDGITIAAPSQIAADLLNTPGRGPNESDALMEWMEANESVWRH